MKRLLVLLIVLGFAAPVKADVFFAFSAEQIKVHGHQRVFFVPFSFNGPSHRAIERKIGVMFDKLRTSRPRIYGDTYFVVKDEGGLLEGHLMLDDATKRFHDFIIGEIYLSMAMLGVQKFVVGPDARPMTDADLKFPYFSQVIPIWEALPPMKFSHTLIRLEKDNYLEAASFYAKLEAKDRPLLARITDLLKNPEPYVRMKVLDSLVRLPLDNRPGLLVPMLRDKDLPVRYRVIQLLQEEKDPKVLGALAVLADSIDDPETQLRAARILVANGKTNYQIYIFLEQLKSKDVAVVVDTINKLADSGDKRVLTALIRNLTHDEKAVRDAAFTGMQKMGDLTALRKLLLNVAIAEDFRKSIAVSLMKQENADFAKVGTTYLIEKHAGDEAVEAIVTIEKRKYEDQLPLVIGALKHKDTTVALAALGVIGRLELFNQLDALTEAAGRKDLNERARTTINELIAKQSVKKVMKIAQGKNKLQRELAVLALVKVAKKQNEEKKDIQPILDLLAWTMKTEKEQPIKVAAVQALFDIGGERNWKRVLRIKDEKDPALRFIALRAGQMLQNEEGDIIIIEKMDDQDQKIKLAAIVAVRERNIQSARSKLKVLVGSRKKEEKLEALRSLVAVSATEKEHRESFDTYKRLIFDMDDAIKLAALTGIQWIIDPTVPPLLQSNILLQHKDPRIRAATLVALGRSKDHNSIEFIARGFADPETIVQGAAVEGLGLMGHKKGATALEEFIRQTDDDELKEKAQQALEDIQNKPKGLLIE
jgi:HEAT repeat protein